MEFPSWECAFASTHEYFRAIFSSRHNHGIRDSSISMIVDFIISTLYRRGSDAEGAGEMFPVTFFGAWTIFPRAKTDRLITRCDFFGRATNLTVSGQLEGELAATLGNVYTFDASCGEIQNTPSPSRRSSDDWAGDGVLWYSWDNMDLAEDFWNTLFNTLFWIIAKTILNFLGNMATRELVSRLRLFGSILSNGSHTAAIDVLLKSGKKIWVSL